MFSPAGGLFDNKSQSYSRISSGLREHEIIREEPDDEIQISPTKIMDEDRNVSEPVGEASWEEKPTMRLVPGMSEMQPIQKFHSKGGSKEESDLIKDIEDMIKENE
jgi:hypothetical protein